MLLFKILHFISLYSTVFLLPCNLLYFSVLFCTSLYFLLLYCIPKYLTVIHLLTALNRTLIIHRWLTADKISLWGSVWSQTSRCLFRNSNTAPVRRKFVFTLADEGIYPAKPQMQNEQTSLAFAWLQTCRIWIHLIFCIFEPLQGRVSALNGGWQLQEMTALTKSEFNQCHMIITK